MRISNCQILPMSWSNPIVSSLCLARLIYCFKYQQKMNTIVEAVWTNGKVTKRLLCYGRLYKYLVCGLIRKNIKFSSEFGSPEIIQKRLAEGSFGIKPDGQTLYLYNYLVSFLISLSKQNHPSKNIHHLTWHKITLKFLLQSSLGSTNTQNWDKNKVSGSYENLIGSVPMSTKTECNWSVLNESFYPNEAWLVNSSLHTVLYNKKTQLTSQQFTSTTIFR